MGSPITKNTFPDSAGPITPAKFQDICATASTFESIYMQHLYAAFFFDFQLILNEISKIYLYFSSWCPMKGHT